MRLNFDVIEDELLHVDKIRIIITKTRTGLLVHWSPVYIKLLKTFLKTLYKQETNEPNALFLFLL